MSVLTVSASGGAIIDGPSPLGISDFPFSYACWSRRTAAVSTQGSVMSMGSSAGSNNWHDFQHYDWGGGSHVAVAGSRISGGTPAYANRSAVTMLADTWYPTVCVFASATSRTVYINDTTAGTNSTNLTAFTGSTNSINGADGRFAVGIKAENDGIYRFTGNVAHLAVWNKALSTAEIAAFMAGGNPLTIANEAGNDHLRAYWAERFEDVGGTIYYKDESGNGYDLTLLSGATEDTVTVGPTVDAPPSSTGIIITGIKEPNEANTLVASVASPRIKVWSGTDDSGAENILFDNEDAIYPITNGELEVPLPAYAVDDVVTVEVMWTVGTERKLFIKETTVVDLGSGT